MEKKGIYITNRRETSAPPRSQNWEKRDTCRNSISCCWFWSQKDKIESNHCTATKSTKMNGLISSSSLRNLMRFRSSTCQSFVNFMTCIKIWKIKYVRASRYIACEIIDKTSWSYLSLEIRLISSKVGIISLCLSRIKF